MSQDFETAAAAAQQAFREKEELAAFIDREKQADQTALIVKEVMQKLADMTSDLELDQLRDVVDSLAGRLETKLEAMDEIQETPEGQL